MWPPRPGLAKLFELLAQIVCKFRRNTFACSWEFEEQNKVLEFSVNIINFLIIINI
jgi:hypothetical protein